MWKGQVDEMVHWKQKRKACFQDGFGSFGLMGPRRRDSEVDSVSTVVGSMAWDF
jgi:hypothetical protein